MWRGLLLWKFIIKKEAEVRNNWREAFSFSLVALYLKVLVWNAYAMAYIRIGGVVKAEGVVFETQRKDPVKTI